MKTQNNNVTRLIAVLIISCVSLTATASAETWFTMSGDTLSTKGGFPWNMPETNYNFRIATDATSAATYTNAVGTGAGMLGLTYSDFEQYGAVTLSGTIAANSLALDTSSYLEIGLVTKAMVQNSEGWYLSGMYNDSVFMTVSTNSSGQYSAKAGDYNMGGGNWSAGINFDDTLDMSYELSLDFDSDVASLRLDNGSGFSSPVTVSFGTSDWTAGYGGYPDTTPEDFTQAALIAQLYNEGTADLNSATFGDITVTPEPASMSLLGLGGIALLRRRRNRK